MANPDVVHYYLAQIRKSVTQLARHVRALPSEAGRLVTPVSRLRWNPDDVIDTYASLLRPDNAYKPIDLLMRRSVGRWRTPIMSS